MCPSHLNTSQFKLEDIGAGGLGKDSWEQLSTGLHLWRGESALLVTNVQQTKRVKKIHSLNMLYQSL